VSSLLLPASALAKLSSLSSFWGTLSSIRVNGTLWPGLNKGCRLLHTLFVKNLLRPKKQISIAGETVPFFLLLLFLI
jgi:hypothetical protein